MQPLTFGVADHRCTRQSFSSGGNAASYYSYDRVATSMEVKSQGLRPLKSP